MNEGQDMTGMPFRTFVAEVGGVAEMAAACGVNSKTVYKWWERGRIPSRLQGQMLRIGKKRGIELPFDTVEAWADGDLCPNGAEAA